jgi:hypothetical protein
MKPEKICPLAYLCLAVSDENETFSNVGCRSFCRGLADSLKFRDVFVLDDRSEQDRVEKLVQTNYKKEFLLNRESPGRDLVSTL